ncbi:MAG: DUF3137 domain-containing protein [Alphaproteobacteria bacterium]|nr:DUF3137 domain-containing protein [Alphaproteobacteria bacterium]
MSTKLDLLSLDDTGLTRLYAERIEPILRTQEVYRRAAMKTFAWRLALVALGAAGVGAAIWFWSTEVFNGLMFGGVAFVAGYWFAYQPLAAVGTNAKSQSLNSIADAIGCTYDLSAFEKDGLPHFQELRLLPSCDRSDYQDCFRGTHKGCAFAFYEGHLETRHQTKNGTTWRTVFRGQLIRIAFPKKFLGTTVVRRDAGIFNSVARWMSTMQRVNLGESRLEKAFEIYSTDQVEARYLIHPVFMERLLALETAFKGARLRCAFIDGDLLVAIEGGDKFELGSMFANLADIARVRIIVADIAEVMRLIEAVLTAEEAVLPAS